MIVSFRSVRVFGDTCKSANGSMSVSRFFRMPKKRERPSDTKMIDKMKMKKKYR